MSASDENQSSRIFVGSLSPQVDQVTLRERFKQYGVIQSINLLMGFGFIQFQNEDEAFAAIQGENQTEFMGKTIDVKPARRNPQKQTQQQDFAGQEQGGRGGMRGRGRGGFNPRGRGYSHQNWQGGDQGYNEDYQQNQQHGYQPRGRGGPRGGHGGQYHGHQQQQAPPAPAKACDCEIVCVSKNQRHYAESIEIRLKHLGMDVDVLFPNPEIPLAKILNNITSRGVLFAILVTPMHEEHRSVTVNMLQGQQQEHRNMPLDDAMNLIAKAFEQQLEDNAELGGAQGNTLPADIASVVGFLSENRPLSVMEYDKLIKYLAVRRQRMLKSEYGDNIPAHLVTPPIGPPTDPAVKAKEEDVKAKILAILNKPKEIAPPQMPQQQAQVPAINANLQKAIDSLIKTGPNLLNQQNNKPPSQTGSSSGGFGSLLGGLGSGPPPPPPQQQQQLFSSYGGGSGY